MDLLRNSRPIILNLHNVVYSEVREQARFTLPHPDSEKYPRDAGDLHHTVPQLAVPIEEVRENFLGLRGVSAEEAMNISINEMLARTLITGLTTLLVLVALLVFGGESIAPFSIALIVGIIVGTYSSIYAASATALLLDINPQDLIEPVKDPSLIDDLP